MFNDQAVPSVQLYDVFSSIIELTPTVYCEFKVASRTVQLDSRNSVPRILEIRGSAIPLEGNDASVVGTVGVELHIKTDSEQWAPVVDSSYLLVFPNNSSQALNKNRFI